jgi:hypothetical protein
MPDERTNADLAKEAMEIINTLAKGGMSAGISDLRFDALRELMFAASKRAGFAAELANQMEEAGIPIPAEALTYLVILAAKRRGTAAC